MTHKIDEIKVIKLAWEFCDKYSRNSILAGAKNNRIPIYGHINNLLVRSGITDPNMLSKVISYIEEHYNF